MIARMLGVVVLWIVAPAGAAEPVDYVTQVKPILQARCFACHGALKQEGALRVDTAVAMLRGGDSGPAVKAADAVGSLLLARISAEDESQRMPPEGEPLTKTQIELLSRWITEGAVAPADEQPERDPRDHWAFKTPVRPDVPKVKNADWNKHPIDAFIAAEHDARGLNPQRLADKRTLLRRVTIDLTGLPPTREQLEAFAADTSPDAYDEVVKRLLDSPQYGERWGRHWMDLWRYSDWWGLGAEVRNSQKHIWHWRDWIIESLNADVGYDEMLRQMLAADELYPNDLDKLRATGFLARQYFKFNRTTWLDETIEHTSKAFLGLTFNCGKCHDHKYDPFGQVEYYRFRAFFEPYQIRTEVLPGESDLERNGLPRVFDCNLDAQTFLHIRGDDRRPDKDRVIEPAIPAFLTFGEFKVEPVTLPPEAQHPGLRPFVLDNYLQAAERNITDARKAVDVAKTKVAMPDSPPPMVAEANATLTVAEKTLAAAEAEPTALRARAAADRARATQAAADEAKKLAIEAARAERVVAFAKAEADVARAELDVLKAPADKKADAEKKLAVARTALEAARKGVESPGESYTPLRGSLKTLESNLENEASRSKPFPATSTGRRTALAKWITDPRHPLTARVAVNHIWARHFGKPLVPTVFEFGRKGTLPTHPQLLDWLAVELMEHGWSMKHLHRLMVTSKVYRLSSSSKEEWETRRQGEGEKNNVVDASSRPVSLSPNLHVDPDNRFYWRMNPIRMEAQVVRDSLLSLAGELDLTRGGPSIPVNDENSRRRSLYFVHSKNEHQKFLEMFDDASVLECYRRAESIVPQQALALENSPLAATMSSKIAVRVRAGIPEPSDDAFIRSAFLTILASEPTHDELVACQQAMSDLRTILKAQNSPDIEARTRLHLVQSLLNHNDFVTVR